MADVTILSLGGFTPRIHPSAFIAPGCRIVGDVEIGPEASIWYNCVIRAEVNRVVIGARSNIQDGSVIHCDGPRSAGAPTLIGDDVLVGHMALLHGCVLEDRAFVGMGAIVLNHARIGGDAMLGAGAMLTERKVIPPRQLWVGRPAKFARELDDEAIAGMRAGVVHYVANGHAHRVALDGASEG